MVLASGGAWQLDPLPDDVAALCRQGVDEVIRCCMWLSGCKPPLRALIHGLIVCKGGGVPDRTQKLVGQALLEGVFTLIAILAAIPTAHAVARILRVLSTGMRQAARERCLPRALRMLMPRCAGVTCGN